MVVKGCICPERMHPIPSAKSSNRDEPVRELLIALALIVQGVLTVLTLPKAQVSRGTSA